MTWLHRQQWVGRLSSDVTRRGSVQVERCKIKPKEILICTVQTNAWIIQETCVVKTDSKQGITAKIVIQPEMPAQVGTFHRSPCTHTDSKALAQALTKLGTAFLSTAAHQMQACRVAKLHELSAACHAAQA